MPLTGGQPIQPQGPGDALEGEYRHWLRGLRADSPRHAETVAELRALLLRVARHEMSRRRHLLGSISGPEVEDLAEQAADDAVVKVISKLDEFRRASRFTTWAIKFAIFEVSAKVARHQWRDRAADAEVTWDAIPDSLAPGPEHSAEQREVLAILARAIEEELTERQRHVFVAIALNDISIDILALELDTSPARPGAHLGADRVDPRRPRRIWPLLRGGRGGRPVARARQPPPGPRPAARAEGAARRGTRDRPADRPRPDLAVLRPGDSDGGRRPEALRAGGGGAAGQAGRDRRETRRGRVVRRRRRRRPGAAGEPSRRDGRPLAQPRPDRALARRGGPRRSRPRGGAGRGGGRPAAAGRRRARARRRLRLPGARQRPDRGRPPRRRRRRAGARRSGHR